LESHDFANRKGNSHPAGMNPGLIQASNGDRYFFYFGFIQKNTEKSTLFLFFKKLK